MEFSWNLSLSEYTFLIVVVHYFEMVLTHTGPLVFFKSTQYDSIINTSWKKAHEAPAI